MTAEALDEIGVARRDRVEHVADVDARDRARRASQARPICEREGDHRAAQAILHPARDQPDHALVPALIEQAYAAALQRPGAGIRQAAHRPECHLLHARFDRAALPVELIEARRERLGGGEFILEQALYADAHVVETAGGV